MYLERERVYITQFDIPLCPSEYIVRKLNQESVKANLCIFVMANLSLRNLMICLRLGHPLDLDGQSLKTIKGDHIV